MKIQAKQGKIEVYISPSQTVTLLEAQTGTEYLGETNDINITHVSDEIVEVETPIIVKRRFKNGEPVDLKWGVFHTHPHQT